MPNDQAASHRLQTAVTVSFRHLRDVADIRAVTPQLPAGCGIVAEQSVVGLEGGLPGKTGELLKQALVSARSKDGFYEFLHGSILKATPFQEGIVSLYGPGAQLN